MMSKEIKTCASTRAVQTHRILPSNTNSHGALFGGRLMEFIDNCASISFSRYARNPGVTASMDNLNFINPLSEDHSVCVETFASGSGTKSAEIFAKVIGEDLYSGKRYLAATAFLTFVSTENKTQNPEIKPETDEEIYVVNGYEKRRQNRLDKLKTNKEFNGNISLEYPWKINN